MMRLIFTTFSICALLVSIHTTIFAAGASPELERVADEVAALQLGFDDYVLGSRLSDAQKSNGLKHALHKSLAGTYKFKDEDIFVIATEVDDIVLGMYKEFEINDPEQIKKIVGNLMFKYGEPTLAAHDKIIYWTYNSKGKISQDTFDFERTNGGAESLAAIKFSSSEKIEQPTEGKEKKAEGSAYLIITSDRLSKLFLAITKTEK